MKMVKTLLALAMIFALVVPVMADVEDDVCPPCTDKCSPKLIGCPAGAQGSSGATVYTCPIGDDYQIPAMGGGNAGYFLYGLANRDALSPDNDGEGSGLDPLIYSDCPVVINICECDVIESGAVALVPGTEISLRMSLLVNGEENVAGAYWAESFSGRVILSNSRAFLCSPSVCATPDTYVTLGVTGYYCDTDADNQNDLVNEVTGAGEPLWRFDSFTTVPMSFTCPSASTNVTKFVTLDSIVIQELDDARKVSHMAVDIPAVAISPAILSCSLVSVKIDVFIGTGISICPTDESECSCIFDLYSPCCESSSNVLIYPYFASNANFWNGIVVTNLTSTDGTVELTAYSKEGEVLATKTGIDVPGYGMFISLLDDDELWPTELGSAQCWVRAVTTFNADGFAMMSNDVHDSMGYLPRLSGSPM